MRTSDTINMKTVKEKLRYLKNNVESCKSIPKDFRGKSMFKCVYGWVGGVGTREFTMAFKNLDPLWKIKYRIDKM